VATQLAELSRDAYERQLRRLAVRLAQRSWYRADYALTLLAIANCRVVAGQMPPWVLIGGFAIRHCYGASRFSRDADLTFDGELYVEGPANVEPAVPTGFSIIEHQSGDEVDHLKIRYARPWGIGSVWLHMNHSRPIKRPPAQVRTFASPLLAETFEVAIAPLEEILADKINGLVGSRDQAQPRAKDMWDLNHLFDLAETFEAATVRELLKVRLPQVKHVLTHTEVSKAYRRAWEVALEPLVEKLMPYDEAVEKLLAHLHRHFPEAGLR
jgi:predicted nucleotidyltransferase component of viral defense system